MNEAELDQLALDCPILFHMAERGSWDSIRVQGLFSTSALLDIYGVTGHPRDRIESERRGQSVRIDAPELPGAVIRDQLPMTDEGLVRSLPPDMNPADWYRILNAKTFFWLSADRLKRLLCAATYREQEHDVLEVDTRSLLDSYRESIWLCPINSGCTKPNPAPRDRDTFARIPDYPYEQWRLRGRRRNERVVELAVDYGIPDIAKFVKRVTVMKAGQEIRRLYPLE